jgi:ubiquinone/menaquinone biosynthesis C-methylase UbiE
MSTVTRNHADSASSREKAYKGLGMEGSIARWYAKNTGRNLDDFRAAAIKVHAQLPPGGNVLEIAPGPGYLAVELAKLGHCRVTGLDISHTFVEMATRLAATAGVEVDFRQGDGSAMPFGDNEFDFVVCRAAFKDFSRPVEALNEMHRVLKPGGTALIIDLSKDASPVDIRVAVGSMNLGAINAALTKLIFRHMLLKRAYRPDDFRALAGSSRFGSCEIRTENISLDVWLSQPPR